MLYTGRWQRLTCTDRSQRRRSTPTSGCKTSLTASEKTTTWSSTARGRHAFTELLAYAFLLLHSRSAALALAPSDRAVFALSCFAFACGTYETWRMEVRSESALAAAAVASHDELRRTLLQRRCSIHAGLPVCHRRSQVHRGLHGAEPVLRSFGCLQHS